MIEPYSLPNFFVIMTRLATHPYRQRGHGGRWIKRPGQHARNENIISFRQAARAVCAEPTFPRKYFAERFLR